MTVLSPEAVLDRLNSMDGWSLSGGEITKTWTAPTFHRAIGFVVQIAMLADAADHHPNLDIRYNRVTATLSTHSVKGITEKDFMLAERMDAAFGAGT